MRRFLTHLLAFSVLPGLLLLLGEAVLQGSGELWPTDRVFAFQRSHPDALYLRGIDQSFYAYKYRGILEKHPSILVAGSSRTMKFRASMFGARANAFYNASGMLNSLNDARDFCRLLPASRTPEVVLLGVDLWWLNEHVLPAFRFESEISKGVSASFDEHIIGIRWLLTHPMIFGSEVIALIGGSDRTAIGISARQRGGGFRLDGSFKSPLHPPHADRDWVFVDREMPPIIDRVKYAFGNFPPTDRVSPERLALLDFVLAEYEKKHVFVIGYLPPFSSAVVTALESDRRHAPFWSDFRRRVPALFRAHGFPVIDASETATIGMDDRAMSDGFHAEETFQVHVLKALLRDGRVQTVFPGAEAVLDRALASPGTNYWEADLGS